MESPGFIKRGAFDDDFPIPVGLCAFSVLSHFESMGGVANFTFTNWDYDEWEPYNSGTFYYIICGVPFTLYFICVIYSGYLLDKWIKGQKKIEMNIGILCLSLEFICAIIRVISMILSPFHQNFDLPSSDVLISLPMCISAITSIMIVFFWLDLTSDPFYRGKFMGMMKIPASILIIVCLLYEISLDIFRSISDQIEFYDPVYAFYSAIQIIVVIFNFVAGFKMLQNLKNLSENRKRLIMIIRRIIYSGFFYIGSFIILVLGFEFQSAMGHTIIWSSNSILSFIQSFLLITIFQIPKMNNETIDTSSTKENSIIKEITTEASEKTGPDAGE